VLYLVLKFAASTFKLVEMSRCRMEMLWLEHKTFFDKNND
jgi:hypothetical protein